MLILKVISRLLDYPSVEMFAAKDELIAVVEASNESNYELTAQNRSKLVSFINQLAEKDIFDAQESYDLLFDRGRALSLLMFEHVHGESRDRGQAMVDLMNVYKTNGFEVDSAQLPDYIPLYLEFLSEQPTEFIEEWLGDIVHLLTMLSERLIDRECDYSVLFDALIDISGQEVGAEARAEVVEAVKKEVRDDTVEVIDKEWEDKEIRFDDPMVGDCSSNTNSASGLHQSKNSLDPNTVHQVPIKWHSLDGKAPDAAQVQGL